MFTFIPSAPPKTEGVRKQNRIRVVGTHAPNSILYSVVSQSKTAIELVTIEGQSKTVISLSKLLDIVSADISEDLEFILFTERFPKGTGFAFRSCVYHINSFSETKAFEDRSPITSFFIGQNELVHVVGSRFQGYEVKYSKNNLSLKKKRGGLVLPKCEKWFYHDQFLYAFHSTSIFSVFSLKENKVKVRNFDIATDDAALLPEELALLPSVPMHHGYFRFSRGNFFVLPVGRNYGVIEQLYLGEDMPFSFSVTVLNEGFWKIVNVHGVQSDLPANFVRSGPVVFIFSIRGFVAFVDFASSPPLIFVLPAAYIDAQITNLSTTIGGTNLLVDLNSGRVFEVVPVLKTLPIPIKTKEDLKPLVVLSSRIPSRVCMPQIFEQLTEIDLIHYFVVKFFESDFFFKASAAHKESNFRRLKQNHPIRIPPEIRDLAQEIERELPSAGNISRKTQFFTMYKQLLAKNPKLRISKVAQYVFDLQDNQNATVMALRTAIDDWDASLVRRFMLLYSIQSESVFVNSPIVPLLAEDVVSLTNEVASPTIKTTCSHFGTLGKKTEIDETEFDFWSSRISSELMTRESSGGSQQSLRLDHLRGRRLLQDLTDTSSSAMFESI